MAEFETTKEESTWFLDSGCSNHMCGSEYMFDTLEKQYTHSVKLGDDSRMRVGLLEEKVL